MEAIRRKRISFVDLRARFPVITRVLALLVLIAGLVFVGLSFYRLRNNQPFRLRSGSPELSREITGVIEGFDQRRAIACFSGCARLAILPTRTDIMSWNKFKWRFIHLQAKNPIR
jgi:uncharacterized membrane protein YedE/YeeE